ncbi:hypothetical protein M5689_003202 [Euphorbia peplus]|nr:hypothetical protein M5689_003202 [Euphorbia peplus]
MEDGRRWTIVSDMQKGLGIAVDELDRAQNVC